MIIPCKALHWCHIEQEEWGCCRSSVHISGVSSVRIAGVSSCVSKFRWKQGETRNPCPHVSNLIAQLKVVQTLSIGSPNSRQGETQQGNLLKGVLQVVTYNWLKHQTKRENMSGERRRWVYDVFGTRSRGSGEILAEIRCWAMKVLGGTDR